MHKSKYLPSIDSLRAIAVIAVIIYHIDVNYLSGGFLGVDLFFVLSGYLISSLIIREYKETGSLSLYNFYIRRARRLLPAVYFMITVVLIFMVLFNGVLLKKSNLDALFGYIYSSNWWYIFHKLDYFDTFGAQSPFKHLWSLAIEEQFYLFFPLIFLLFARDKRKSENIVKSTFKYIVIALIIISFITQIILFDINNVSRVYFGTDTRAFSLLVGVLGAILYPMENLEKKATKRESKIYSLVSLFSIILLIFLMIFVNEYQSWMYYGGFLLVALVSLIAIISSGKQNTIMSKLLSFKPLVYIGKISYSLYLWHFPVLVLTTPTSELGNPNLFYTVLRIILIFILATASYYFVETPIRKVGFANYVKSLLRKINSLAKRTKQAVLSVAVVTVLLFIMGIFGQGLPYLSTAFVSKMDTENKQSQFISNGNSSENSNSNNNENNKEQTNSTYDNLLVIGDSLTVDIGANMQEKYPGVIIDGQISRQLYNTIALADNYAQYNNDKTAVVFQLGTNGTFTQEQFEELVKKFDKADIYFVNVKVPRAWEKTVNSVLTEGAKKFSNVTIIDWYTVASSHPEYFEPDRVHLKQEGSAALTQLISQSFKKKVSFEKIPEEQATTDNNNTGTNEQTTNSNEQSSNNEQSGNQNSVKNN